MNVSTNSECSSGCESGWTMYLDQFSNSNDYYNYNRGDFVKTTFKEEEDEDLSMVSDASSGPPHNHEYQKQSSETQYCYGGSASSFSQGKMKKKLSINKTEDQMLYCKERNMCLDDTASSPFYHYSKDNVAPSDNHYSMENVQCEVESKTKKHLSFFKSSSKGKSGSLLGRKKH